jgi:hypothetical protein
MEQRAVIRFLTLKRLGVQQITSKLESVYHTEALTLTKSLRRLVCGDDILEPVKRKGREPDGLVDFKTLATLTAFPFHSVRTLASSLKIPRSTM